MPFGSNFASSIILRIFARKSKGLNMINWRWDQGRIIYFQFDVLKEIARVLVKYEGKSINDDQIAFDLKNDLKVSTGLPFLPENYKVNRNYSRVFQCALLATTQGRGGELIVSDICKELAGNSAVFESADDYLFEVINRFRFPFPAFQEYENAETSIYPFCAILKLLIAKRIKGEEASLTISDIGKYLIGNQCTGLEDIDFYKNLRPSSFELIGDNMRQVREMVIFIGQLSFLKIFDKKIFLDILGADDAKVLLNQLIKPIQTTRSNDKIEEFISLTSITHRIVLPGQAPSVSTSEISLPNTDISDVEFVEGRRKRVHHLRIERSPMLRRIYIQLHPEPICDACKSNIKEKYPWTNYMLDLHHLLPLSSVIRTSETGTSLSDMVGLCPSCHRAIHSYYSKWLKENSIEDFRSKKEAMEVYLNAIKEIA